MTYEEFYGEYYQVMIDITNNVLAKIEDYKKSSGKDNPLEYCHSRIKKPDSMIEKLKRNGLSVDLYSALFELHDAIGLRVIVSFIDDVYDLVNWFNQQEEWKVIEKKDYIAFPKENGYRSYHLILKYLGLYIEIQIRTIAMDFWASLEHQMKYKKEVGHQKVVVNELKRCADEIASIDVSMQTIRDLMNDEDFNRI